MQTASGKEMEEKVFGGKNDDLSAFTSKEGSKQKQKE